MYGFINSFEKTDDGEELLTMESLFQFIIQEQKKKFHADGSRKDTFECYEKVRKKLIAYCQYAGIKYEKLMVCDMTTAFIDNIFDWICDKNAGKGYMYVSKMLHAVMNFADKKGIFDMNTIRSARWKKKTLGSSNKYKTLTDAQCKCFEGLDVKELPKNKHSLLYRDFCVFLLYTGQSPCDAISLKYSDIETINGVDHFVFKRRKISDKQAVPCSVPINDSMRKIMNRWKKRSSDGYVFPIRSKKTLLTQKTSNGDIKHFVSRINGWLKEVAKIIGCDFSLHTYTFRHTAITRYISLGVPVTYVANLMGTSVKNCEQIYYNNQGDTRSMNMVMSMVI